MHKCVLSFSHLPSFINHEIQDKEVKLKMPSITLNTVHPRASKNEHLKVNLS